MVFVLSVFPALDSVRRLVNTLEPAVSWDSVKVITPIVEPGGILYMVYTATVNKQCPSDLRGFLVAEDGTVPVRFPPVSGGYTKPSDDPVEIRVSITIPKKADNGLAPLHSGRIQQLGAPVAANDAARLIDVQSAAAGIDSKASVRVASTTHIDTATGGLLTVDGVTLVAGDRVLCRVQNLSKDNGIYIAAAGAWSRATDADATGEITPGAFWYVEEGSTQAATQWRCSNTGTITLGTTGINIVKFGASAMYTASNGVQLTSNNFNGVVEANKGLSVGASGFAVVADVNSSVALSASGVGVKLFTNGGLTHDATNGIRVMVSNSNGTTLNSGIVSVVHDGAGGTYNTSNGIRVKLPANSGLVTDATGLYLDTTKAVRKYAATIGDGTSTSITVNHGLGSSDFITSLRDINTFKIVDADVEYVDSNNIKVNFDVAPAASSIRVMVHV
jgi:hypothetical protein